MARIPKCPHCRGTNILISYEKEEEANFLAVFFGIFYILWLLIRCVIGVIVFCFYDAWRAIVEKKRGKGHLFVSKRFFRGSKKSYYCQDCKMHFKE